MASLSELYDQADQLKMKGDLPAAAAKLNELLAMDPDYALAHSALAIVHQRLGDHEKAIEHAAQVCKLEPSDPFSFTALSVTYQRAYAATGERSYITKAEDAMANAHALQSRH